MIYHAEAEGWMVDKEECMEVWALKRRGYSHRAIARKLGIHRKTVKKYVETREFPSYQAVLRKSALGIAG